MSKPNLTVKDLTSLDAELRHDYDHLDSRPFTSSLTAQEIYMLQRSGYEPFQIAIGTIVYSMGLTGAFRTFLRAFSRGEMVDFSHLQRVARDLAIARMREHAATIKADGVVNVKVEAIQYADFLEVVAMGTAVRKIEGAAPDSTEVVVSA